MCILVLGFCHKHVHFFQYVHIRVSLKSITVTDVCYLNIRVHMLIRYGFVLNIITSSPPYFYSYLKMYFATEASACVGTTYVAEPTADTCLLILHKFGPIDSH